FFSSRRRHTRFSRDWSSDVCSSDLTGVTRRTRAAGDVGEGLRVPKTRREATLDLLPGLKSGEEVKSGMYCSLLVCFLPNCLLNVAIHKRFNSASWNSYAACSDPEPWELPAGAHA